MTSKITSNPDIQHLENEWWFSGGPPTELNVQTFQSLLSCSWTKTYQQMLTGVESCNYRRKLHLPQTGGTEKQRNTFRTSPCPYTCPAPSHDPSNAGLLSPCATPHSCVSQLFLEASNMEELMTQQYLPVVYHHCLWEIFPNILSKFHLKQSQNRTSSSAHFLIKPVTKFFYNKRLAE